MVGGVVDERKKKGAGGIIGQSRRGACSCIPMERHNEAVVNQGMKDCTGLLMVDNI